jgi:hypothetical protein
VISIKAFFLAAYQACFLTFVSVFRRSVSDPFPVVQNIFSQRGFCCNNSRPIIINCNLAYFSKSVNYRFQEDMLYLKLPVRLRSIQDMRISA